jgi:carbon monoxide dehydrogenase subunit G
MFKSPRKSITFDSILSRVIIKESKEGSVNVSALESAVGQAFDLGQRLIPRLLQQLGQRLIPRLLQQL